MPRIRRETLTKTDVDSAKTSNKAYRMWDAKVTGLCLRVLPSGIKTFEVHVGRNVSKRLGRYPGMTLDVARNEARKAQGTFSEHGATQVKSGKPKTLETFLRDDYEPWVIAERKAGAATTAAIRSVWADLLKKPLTEINAWVVEKIKAARLKSGIKPATVNRDLVRIKAALAKAVEWKKLDAHPLTSVKRAQGEDDGRVRFLTPSEETTLRDTLVKRDAEIKHGRASGNAWREERGRELLPTFGKDEFADHLHPLVLLAMNTGLRRGELFSLTWSAVDMHRKMLTVRADTAKSGRTRHVPLNAEAIDVLKRWRRTHRDEGFVFAGASGDRMTNINKSWAALTVAAKLKDFRFHDLRHHFASKLVMASVDLYTVKELLGHSDFEMTQRYAHLAPEHKAAAVEKLMG